jgi:hypothetical protein
MKAPLIARFCFVAWAVSAPAQTANFDSTHLPRFEDYPVTEVWHGTPAPLKVVTRSERMFKTQLTKAVNEAPNFAGHYRFTYWGCGSNCGAGALIDLKTGDVFPPPLGANGAGWSRWIISPALFDGSGIESHLESRLVIIRSGINYSERLQKNVPDAHYFVWEDNRFSRILFISGKQLGSKPPRTNP